jgi:hypothetical protein
MRPGGAAVVRGADDGAGRFATAHEGYSFPSSPNREQLDTIVLRFTSDDDKHAA